MRAKAPERPTSKSAKAHDSAPSLIFCEAADLLVSRRRYGRGWGYFDDAGARITDRGEIARLNALAVPPAYKDVRLNGDPRGHLQAIGIDARGRRQYRYHPAFRAARDESKFSACAAFGERLPKMRASLERQLKAPPTSYEAVLAAMVRILDTAYVRVGNEAYVRSNRSFGLSTLRMRHLRNLRSEIELRYRGKGGAMRTVRLSDRSLLRVVRQCQHLPGQRLFQYRSADGDIRPAGSAEVNNYLREMLGGEFTAKDFRTWHASVIAFEQLCTGATASEAVASVAAALGNTPAVARKSYIHPGLLDADSKIFQALALPRAGKYMTRAERGFLAWLQKS